MKVTVRLQDKETGVNSKPVPIEDIIYKQNYIEFEFGEPEDDDYGTLPYKDFLFFSNDYNVIVNVKGDAKYGIRESD